MDYACEFITFVKCLYRFKNNQQTAGDQQPEVILGLTS